MSVENNIIDLDKYPWVIRDATFLQNNRKMKPDEIVAAITYRELFEQSYSIESQKNRLRLSFPNLARDFRNWDSEYRVVEEMQGRHPTFR